jgi:hypothetical protein
MVQYSHHPKTGLSGIQMKIFRTLLKSGFQMLKTRWLPPFNWQTGFWTILSELSFNAWKLFGKSNGGPITYTTLNNPEHFRIHVQWTTEYRTVRYSNGHFSDTFCVQFWNGLGRHFVFYHLKTGLFVRFCPVFELSDHLKTGSKFFYF